MTRDDIIRMAREADDYADKVLNPGEFHPDWHEVRDAKFASLVAAAERESCAKVCEAVAAEEVGMAYEAVALDCAVAVRKRGAV